MAITEKYVTVAGGGLHDGTSEANAWTFTEALANAVAGDRVNVKLGTHACTTASVVNGTYADPIYVRGYVSTIGDLDALPLGTMVGGTDIPLVVGTGADIGFRGKWVNLSYIEFEGTSSSAAPWKLHDMGQARSCRFKTTNLNSFNLLTAGDCILQDCYFYGGAGLGNTVWGADCTVINCVFQGINWANIRAVNAKHVVNCLFMDYDRPVQGDVYQVTGCTFVNCGIGVNVTPFAHSSIVTSCYFSNCTSGVVSNGTANVTVNSCCYHNVTTQITGVDFQHFASVDATDQFVDSAGDDYTLLPTSNGYSSAMPNILAGLGTVTKQDIGAIRHADAGGGGATHYDPFTNPRF